MNRTYKLKGLICLIISLVVVACVFSGCKLETVKEYNASTSLPVSNAEESWSAGGENSTENGETVSTTSSTKKSEDSQDNDKTTEVLGNANATSQSQPPSTSQTPQKNEGATNKAPTKSPIDETTTSAVTPQSINVTVSVSCKNAVGNKNLKDGIVLPTDGFIINSISVAVTDNNVFEATKQACKKNGTAFLYSGSMFGKYVSKIGPIAEKECGAESGWTFTVNGEYPQKTCESVELKEGDKIQWIYKAT